MTHSSVKINYDNQEFQCFPIQKLNRSQFLRAIPDLANFLVDFDNSIDTNPRKMTYYDAIDLFMAYLATKLNIRDLYETIADLSENERTRTINNILFISKNLIDTPKNSAEILENFLFLAQGMMRYYHQVSVPEYTKFSNDKGWVNENLFLDEQFSWLAEFYGDVYNEDINLYYDGKVLNSEREKFARKNSYSAVYPLLEAIENKIKNENYKTLGFQDLKQANNWISQLGNVILEHLQYEECIKEDYTAEMIEEKGELIKGLLENVISFYLDNEYNDGQHFAAPRTLISSTIQTTQNGALVINNDNLRDCFFNICDLLKLKELYSDKMAEEILEFAKDLHLHSIQLQIYDNPYFDCTTSDVFNTISDYIKFWGNGAIKDDVNFIDENFLNKIVRSELKAQENSVPLIKLYQKKKLSGKQLLTPEGFEIEFEEDDVQNEIIDSEEYEK